MNPTDCLGCVGILAGLAALGLALCWRPARPYRLHLFLLAGCALTVSALAYLDQIRP